MIPPDSRRRSLFDLAWLVAFAVALTLVLVRASSAGSVEQGAALDLAPGGQTMSLLWRGQKVGTVHGTTRREGDGWVMTTRFARAGRETARMHLSLHRDLSLGGFSVNADLAKMIDVGGIASLVAGRFGRRGEVAVSARCQRETGACRVKGRLAGRKVNLSINAGRGPVLSGAVYPLLARGSLGRTAEVSIFDPLSLERRLITFRVKGRETLRLPAGTFEAVKISRDIEGMATHVWVDRRGRVLREELPLGIVLRHERFVPAAEEAP